MIIEKGYRSEGINLCNKCMKRFTKDDSEEEIKFHIDNFTLPLTVETYGEEVLKYECDYCKESIF